LDNKNDGRVPLNQKFRNFRNGGKWYGNFLEKFPKNPKIVKFPKCEPFNLKIRNFRNKNQMEQNSRQKIFGNLGIAWEVAWKLWKMLFHWQKEIFLSQESLANNERKKACKDKGSF
jgi:hypothetical protein